MTQNDLQLFKTTKNDIKQFKMTEITEMSCFK